MSATGTLAIGRALHFIPWRSIIFASETADELCIGTSIHDVRSAINRPQRPGQAVADSCAPAFAPATLVTAPQRWTKPLSTRTSLSMLS